MKRKKQIGGENVTYPNIAAERARRGMTMDQLAQELGVTRKTIYNWQNNGKIPMNKLIKMADIFHCSIDYLVETT